MSPGEIGAISRQESLLGILPKGHAELPLRRRRRPRSLYLVQSHAGKSRQWCVPKALHDPVRHAVGEYQEIQRLMNVVSELEWKRLLARKR
jgi:hypothetical protein